MAVSSDPLTSCTTRIGASATASTETWKSARGRRRAVRGLPRLGHQGQRHGAAPVDRRRQRETGELRRRHGPRAVAVIGAGGEARSGRQSLDRHRQHLGIVHVGQQRRKVERNRLILLPCCIMHRDSGSVGDGLHRNLEGRVRRGGDAVRTHGIGLKGQVDRAGEIRRRKNREVREIVGIDIPAAVRRAAAMRERRARRNAENRDRQDLRTVGIGQEMRRGRAQWTRPRALPHRA